MTFTCLPHGRAWAPFASALAGLAGGVRVVYEDADVLVADKPRGVAVARADGGDDTLEDRLRALYGDVRPVHRLDVATAGLVLFARNAAAEAALSEAIRMRAIRKFYRCTVRAVATRSALIWRISAIRFSGMTSMATVPGTARCAQRSLRLPRCGSNCISRKEAALRGSRGKRSAGLSPEGTPQLPAAK